MRWALASLAAFLAVATPAAAAPDQRLSAIAGEIVGSPVRLECKPKQAFPGGAIGTAFHGRALIWLREDHCAMLQRFVRAPAKPPWVPLPLPSLDPTYTTLVNAATAVAHEAWHLRGVRDEATTDCYAVQLTWRVLVRLGARVAWARAFARTWVPMVHGLPAIADCRDGGLLDLDPRPGWPNR